MKDELESLMNVLNAAGFFRVDLMDWVLLTKKSLLFFFLSNMQDSCISLNIANDDYVLCFIG